MEQLPGYEEQFSAPALSPAVMALLALACAGGSLLVLAHPKLGLPLLLALAALVLAFRNTELFLRLTLVGLALHTFVFAHLLPKLLHLSPGLIGAWKEGAMGLLLLVLLLRLASGRERLLASRLNLLLPLYFALGLLYVFFARNLAAGFYGLRNDFEYFIFFFLGANLTLGREEVRKIVDTLLLAALLISVWGIIQPLVFGPHLLVHLGYGENGALGPSFYIGGFLFQRAVGTFSSPNDLAAFLMMVLLLGLAVNLMEADPRLRRRRATALFVMMLCFLYTVSRSAYLGFFVGAILLAICMKNRRILRYLALFTVVALALGIASGAIEHVVDTLTLKDPSTRGHIHSMLMSLHFIAAHPFGIGIGMAGPKSGRFIRDYLLDTESSYFVIMFEMGYAGLLLLLAVLGSALKECRKAWRTGTDPYLRQVALGILAALVATLVQYFFLPTIQELPTAALLWFLTGLALQLGGRQIHGQA